MHLRMTSIRGRLAAVLISALTAVGVVLALLNQAVLASIFGAAVSLDALFAAVSVPVLLVGVVSAANDALLAPALAAANAESGADSAAPVATTNLLVITGVLATSCLAVVLSARWYVPVVFPGFDAAQRALTLSLVPLMAGSAVMAGVSDCLLSLLTYHRRFLMPPLAGYFLPLAPLLFAVTGGAAAGIRFVAWGYLSGEACRLAVMVYGARHMLSMKVDAAAARAMRRRLKPMLALLATNLLYGSTAVVEKTLASTLAPGSITVLYLAQRLAQSTAALSTAGVATVTYPELARLGRASNASAIISPYLSRALRAVSVYSGLLAAGAIVFGTDVFALLFWHGRMTHQSVALGGHTLAAASGLLLLSTAGTLIVRAMYAEERRRIPNMLNVCYVVVFSASAVLLTRVAGTPGIAAATSIAWAVNYSIAALAFWSGHRGSATVLFARPFVCCGLGLACLLGGRWLATQLPLSGLPFLVVGAGAGTALYLATLMASKDRGLRVLFGRGGGA